MHLFSEFPKQIPAEVGDGSPPCLSEAWHTMTAPEMNERMQLSTVPLLFQTSI